MPAPDARHELARAYRLHRDYVRRCLRNAGLGGDALDDGVHDVFAVLVRRLADFQPGSTMRQWLAGISRNVAWAHHRRARRSVGERPSAEPSVRPELELRIDLCRSLADLDEPQRTAVLLADGNGLSAHEIAAAQGVPLTTAQWRIRSARARLRSTLERMASGLAILDPRAWLRPLVLTGGAATALIGVAGIVAPAEPVAPAAVVGSVEGSTNVAARGESRGGEIEASPEIEREPDDRLTAHVRIGEPRFESVAPRMQEPQPPPRSRKPARARPRPRTRPADSDGSAPDVDAPSEVTAIESGPIAIDAHRVRSGRPPVF